MSRHRMFHLGEVEAVQTWNPVIGCLHRCYGDGCWAAKVCKVLQRDGNAKIREKYEKGFHVPRFFPEVLEKARFSRGKTYFVVSMGDLFGTWVLDEWIREVLAVTRKWPKSRFFFETKNPGRHMEFLGDFPVGAILSTTIETDNAEMWTSEAPNVFTRWVKFRDLKWPTKHISIEPIMEFNLTGLVRMIEIVKPWMVAVGYDSLKNGLEEPALEKTMRLIGALESAGIKVERKLLREKLV